MFTVADDPVIFFEPKRLYQYPFEMVPINDYTLPLGEAEILQYGTDVTVVAWGAHLGVCAEAIKMVTDRDGISVELIDLQTIIPWDKELILKSVKKTGRVIVTHEACITGGFAAEMSSVIQEHCFLHLQAPVKRVCAMDTPVGLIYEKFNIPNKFKVYEALRNIVEY